MDRDEDLVLGIPASAPDGHVAILIENTQGLWLVVRQNRTGVVERFPVREAARYLFLRRQWSKDDVAKLLTALTPARIGVSVIAAAVKAWYEGRPLIACRMIHSLTPGHGIYSNDRCVLLRLEPSFDWLPTPEVAPIVAATAYLQHEFHPILLHNIQGRTPEGQPICSCGRGMLCKATGKHPRLSGWKVDKPTPFVIEEWWSRWPEANVGLAMGGDQRIVALDIDGTLGHESLAALEAEHGSLPTTLAQRTGREDGEQRLFRVPDELDMSRIRSTVGHVGPGLDVRGARTLIVVSPSLHKSGRRYQWTTAQPMAPLPEWLYARMSAPPVRPGRPANASIATGYDRPPDNLLPPLPAREALAIQHLAKMPPAIEGQNGSLATIKAAIVVVRGYCLPPDNALKLLMSQYNPRCRPPWSEWELAHKVESAECNMNVPWGYLYSYLNRGEPAPEVEVSEETNKLIAAMLKD